MKDMYRWYTAHPPMKNGQRHRGSSSADEYWRGFDGHKSMSPSKDSPSYRAWMAGRDAAKGETI